MSSHVVRALGEWRSATRCLGRVIMLRERALASRSRSEPDAARIARLERIERAVREVEADARRTYERAQREAIETARAGDATSSTLADVHMTPAPEEPGTILTAAPPLSPVSTTAIASKGIRRSPLVPAR